MSSTTIDRLDESQQTHLFALLHSGVSREELCTILQSGSSEQWEDLLRKFTPPTASASGHAPHMIRGSEVILSGGSGKKRKHNGYRAKVVRYPKSGGWMTVRIGDSQGGPEGENVKWRKGGCTTLAQSSLLGLDDDTLSHIVGFLGHGLVADETEANQEDSTMANKLLLGLADAARQTFQIASVCRRLAQFAEDNMDRALGHIDANFDALKEDRIVPCILWLCKYKLCLGQIKLRADLADIPMMCQLLQECDTEQVTFIQAYANRSLLCFKETVENSRLIRLAWTTRFSDSCQVLNLLGNEFDPDIEQMALDLGVPFRDDACWKELHDAIAQQCPNVSHLCADAKIAPDRETRAFWKRCHFSPSLFAMPSVTKLELSVGCCTETMFPSKGQVDSCFINTYIQGLENLESLEIGFSNHFIRYSYKQRFHIASPNLRSLNVERLSKRMWISCSCPKLERFVCNGNFYGNGTRPNFTYEQMCSHQGDAVAAGDLIGMEIPAECQCILTDFGRYAETVRYQSYVEYVLNDIRNARFWTEPDSGCGN